MALTGSVTGLQAGSLAGGWNLDQNSNSKSATGNLAAPTRSPHCLPLQPPSRLSLGSGAARGPECHRLRNPGQASDSNSEGSNHDYLPLVRTREVEGGTARARALSQLTSPPTSSLLRCGCRRHLAPSVWTHPFVQQCTSHRSVCAEPHPLLCTVPASAPPQPHLPGYFWARVLARATAPRPPAVHLTARVLRVWARWTVGGVQTRRPQRGGMGQPALICGAGPGPQLWHWHGWSTAVLLPLESGNWQQLRLTAGYRPSTCPMALIWLPSRLQPGVSSCCYATGTKICSYTCCATARQMCKHHQLLRLEPHSTLKSLPPRTSFSVLERSRLVSA